MSGKEQKAHSEFKSLFNNIDFWLCEYAKRNLYLSDKDDYQDLLDTYNKLLEAGNAIWNIFKKDFNRNNSLELIKFYASNRLPIMHYFPELSQPELQILDDLGCQIGNIIEISEKYGFIYCDLLMDTKESIINISDSLKLLILYNKAESQEPSVLQNLINSNKNTSFTDSPIFTKLQPIRFPSEKGIHLPDLSLYKALKYDEKKDLVTLQLKQVTDNNSDYPSFLEEIRDFLNCLRYQHINDELKKTVISLTEYIVNCFYQDFKPKENGDTVPIAMALDNKGFHSLNDKDCYANKQCRKLINNWEKNKDKNLTLNLSSCNDSKQKDYRCTCCLVTELKENLNNGELPLLPIGVMHHKKYKKLIRTFANLKQQLKESEREIETVHKNIINKGFDERRGVNGIESRLLGLFLWDAK